MSGAPDQSDHESQDVSRWGSRLGESVREVYPLTNAVEWDEPDEGSTCYVYPADASDSELETRWLAAPAWLLMDLEEAR